MQNQIGPITIKEVYKKSSQSDFLIFFILWEKKELNYRAVIVEFAVKDFVCYYVHP